MVSFDLNKQTMEVRCENGHSNTVSLGDIRAKKKFKCRGCDQMIELKPDANFESEVRKVEMSLADLKRTIDGFGH